MTHLLETIRHPQGSKPNYQNHGQGSQEAAGPSEFEHRTASTIWRWLAARRDVSIGPDRAYNHLTLDEVLALPPDSPAPVRNEDGEAPEPVPETHHVRVYASEETMWESLTGHAIDYKRVPRSEWLLLLGIASKTTDGILQGDLGRLVDQDKRSVPKRTDALLRKGYIVKRTTLVRGTKTSKMWLKNMAPPLPKDADANNDEPRPDMNITREILVSNLDPVPWHARWTGESVDYTALATTILAIVKEWGVLRISDLKAKLGVLGMRWQMKVLAKVCRWLNFRGVIQYVAAKLEEKVFKDCIKYGRDLNPEDWTLFLATGKRTKRPSRNAEVGADESNDVIDPLLSQSINASEVSSLPPWSLDKPLSATIVEGVQRSGDAGVTNPAIYGMTLGSTFSRYISSLTAALSVPGLQPSHLKHLQLRSEHTRIGKIASYRYFALQFPTSNGLEHNGTSSPVDGDQTASPAYGFAPISGALIPPTSSTFLTDICNARSTGQKSRGRAKKGNVTKKVVEVVEVSQEAQEVQEVVETQEEAPKKTPKRREPKTPQNLPGPLRLMVKLKVQAEALKALLGSDVDQTNIETPSRSTRPRRARNKPSTINIDVTDSAMDIDDDGDDANEVGNATKSAKKKGRGKRGADTDSPARPWKCEKCGGSWKNDIGLKYHLEKSKTPCNPLFDVSQSVTRRGKKPESLESSVAPLESPTPAVSTQAVEPDDAPQVEEEPDNDEDNEALPSPSSRQTSAGKSREQRNSVASRSPIKLNGGPFQPPPEWRRPAMMALDASKKDGLPGSNGSVLMDIQETQPRPVLSLSRSQSVSNLSKPRSGQNDGQLRDPEQRIKGPTIRPESSLNIEDPNNGVQSLDGADEELPDAPQPTISEQMEQIEYQKSDTVQEEEKSSKINQAEKDAASRILLGNGLSRSAMNYRIGEMIKNLLEEQGGLFPGEKALWHAITTTWSEKYPTETAPTTKACQAALRELLKKGEVADHWHAFRDERGMFSKCQIVIQSGMDPFSAEAIELVEKIKEAFPQLYMPSPFTLPADTGKDPRRGRRNLAGEVEVLDAPMYAALSLKRKLDDMRPAPAAKRLRQRRRTNTADSTPTKARRSNRVDRTPDVEQHLGVEEYWDGYTMSMPLQMPMDEIKFLTPNTYLDEEPQGSARRPRPPSRAMEAFYQQDQQSFSENVRMCLVYDHTFTISGSRGAWPYLDVQYFEWQDTSFTLNGWMPDAAWFSWSTILLEVARRTAELNSRKRLKRGLIGARKKFINSLRACVDVEQSWADWFVNAAPGAAGPHNLFIRHYCKSFDYVPDHASITWPKDGQLTLESMQQITQEQENDSGSSSGDDLASDPEGVDGMAVELLNYESMAPDDGTWADYPERSRYKRVPLVSRALTALPAEHPESRDTQVEKTENENIDDPERLLAAFVTVRVLLGGLEKSIDWGLLLHIFPGLGVKPLRRFWLSARKERGAFIAKLTEDFQTRFLVAYQREELPEFDYDDPFEYDWHGLIDWTMKLPRKEGVHLPATKEQLEDNFSTEAAPRTEDEWQDKFFHPQASVYSRFEWATAGPATVTVDEKTKWHLQGSSITDLDVAKSWVRSLCCTDESKYTVQQIKDKFSALGPDPERNTKLVQQAIDQLTQERVICKSRKPMLGGRPYRLNEYFTYMVGKLGQQAKYQEAALLKTKLDTIFSRGDRMKVPYTLDDGSVMALTNLNAAGRIRLVPVDLPDIPWGFEPGNYESRKFPKSYYYFGMEVVPTERYLYNEDIDVLKAIAAEGPPPGSPRGELPQWIDFFGKRDAQRWMEILGAFCFMYATRGFLTTEGVCSALRPILEEFEAQAIIDWGKKTGVLKDSEEGYGTIVGEWWWLAVPWQVR